MTDNKKILSMMKFSEPMSAHTTFKIGGPADIWAQPEDEESLAGILALCRQDGIRVIVAGNGSNLLVKDRGIKGCVINLSSDVFKKIKIEGNTVIAGSGLGIPRLLNVLSNNGLSGIEFMAGIPATVGGALAMNAGGKNRILNYVEETSVLEKDIILSARIRLELSNKEEIRNRINKYLQEKREKQELDSPSAGCIFKNPEGNSAGKLIDLSGLKGRSVGGAMVSTRHANFIINTGGACCDDVLRLMDIVRDRVKKDHGIALEPEIEVL